MTCIFRIGVQGLSQSLHRNICICTWNYEEVNGILHNIETLGLYIFKTTYPISIKFIEVM